MKISVGFVEGMHFVGKTPDGLEVHFDAVAQHGGQGRGTPPMVVLLESIAACTAMDVISILRKKRKTVVDLKVHATAKRAEQHPRVFETVHLTYELWSPDAEMKDLNRSIELSQDKYCGASAIVKRSGAQLTWEAVLHRTGS